MFTPSREETSCGISIDDELFLPSTEETGPIVELISISISKVFYQYQKAIKGRVRKVFVNFDETDFRLVP
jgi:hypothetical protein